jgi:membrane protease subunit HflK
MLQRFGKVIDDKIQPGIHFTLPWPIYTVTKVPIKIVKRMLIDDFYSADSNENFTSRVFSEMTGLDSYCMTGDNNLVNVMCVIQFNITKPFDYIFRVKEPDIMLRSMASNTIIHCLARMPIDEALTRGKQEMVYYIRSELQQILDDTHSGVSVSFVEIGAIRPPSRVQDVFSDVVKADIDREKMINEATAYWNEKIPAAKAEATRILQEAEAYRREVVLKAEGDTDRFLNLLKQAQRKGDSVRNMIYLEAMKEIMANIERKRIVMRNQSDKPAAQLKLYCPE